MTKHGNAPLGCAAESGVDATCDDVSLGWAVRINVEPANELLTDDHLNFLNRLSAPEPRASIGGAVARTHLCSSPIDAQRINFTEQG
jgi:hypothetical protein